MTTSRAEREGGGGANPASPLACLERRGLEYTILDVSHEELDEPTLRRPPAASVAPVPPAIMTT